MSDKIHISLLISYKATSGTEMHITHKLFLTTQCTHVDKPDAIQ